MLSSLDINVTYKMCLLDKASYRFFDEVIGWDFDWFKVRESKCLI